MTDVTMPCKNTAKMLGAKSLEALNFGDACFGLVNYINQDLKANARKIILATNLYGKSFEQWLEHYHSLGIKSPQIDGELPMMNLETTKKEFNYGFVHYILSQLITKQYQTN